MNTNKPYPHFMNAYPNLMISSLHKEFSNLSFCVCNLTFNVAENNKKIKIEIIIKNRIKKRTNKQTNKQNKTLSNVPFKILESCVFPVQYNTLMIHMKAGLFERF